jgi:transcriptional regulator with XRE-family HTH domain
MAVTPARAVAAEMASMRLGELNMTQQQLADKTGMSLESINRFLRGHHWPQVRNRVKISLALWDDSMRLDELAKGRVASDELAAENAALRKLLAGPNYPSRETAERLRRQREGELDPPGIPDPGLKS